VTLAGFAVVLIAISMVTQDNSQYKQMTPLVGAILSATGIALLLRRSHPLTGLVLAGIPVAIFTLLDYDVAGASAALLLSVYAVGAYGKRVHSLLGLAYVLGIILVRWLVGTPEFDFGQALRTGRSSPRGCSARAWRLAGSTSRASERAVARSRS
jgi:hypothetical protein